ncbi:LamG domain-containing protein [Flavivirga eckloniae]|uniref:LamG-like jellyroll fold domain-containing protein n=1 Tax=Flavivirga eckloniae TaxID=1803846 RepID=A0A2K9PTE9_9FLAO|nr:LamG domain-containing protein [Flavivirga eckloniae]AUP80088.1 hypothetical protein C1H87_15785 [Flavivirga eckloniae]
MKINDIKNKVIVGILPLLLILFTVSCANDDDNVSQSFDIAQLQARITEAEDLITTSVEGINAGDYQPGSKEALQDIVNWVYWRIDNSNSQGNIDDAILKLNAGIDTFLASTVSVAIPWIKQEPGTYIELSDNAKAVTANPFTIEAKFYIVNLQQRGYSNNMFANVMGLGGANDRGFNIRYFGDGAVHINVSSHNNGWSQTSTAPGVVESGKWIHVTFVNNINNHALYIDGVEVLTNDNEYAASDSEFPLTIGNTFPWNDRVLNAMVQDFRLWDKTLSPEEINQYKDGVEGTESNLVSYFPFNTDLGSNPTDMIGNTTAKFVGDFDWRANGEPPVIVVDYADLSASITSLTDFISTVVEGTQDGDFPVGTTTYLQGIADAAQDLIDNEADQRDVDGAVERIADALAYANNNKVQDTDGIMIDLDDPDAIGYNVAPSWHAEGNSFTIEISVKLNSLTVGNNGDIGGEILNNGSYLLRYFGENDNARSENYGKLRFYTNNGDWNWIDTPFAILVPGNWINIACTLDTSTGTQSIYVDGVLIVSQVTGVTSSNAPWGDMWLGNGWLKMNGSVKNVRIWSRVLTPGEMGADLVGNEADLEMYFPLDRVSAKVAPDATGNYSGEVRGATWNKN